MSIQYKVDVIAELKNAGYSSYRIRKEKLFGQATITLLRNKTLVSYDNINRICKLLQCDVGDILQYVPDEE